MSTAPQTIPERPDKKSLQKQQDRFREMGWQFYLQQEYALAERNYLRAIEIENNHPSLRDATLYLLLGHVFYQQDKFKEAREQYQKACERATLSNGYALPRWLRKTIARPPVDQNYYHSYVANASFKLGEYDDAIQEFRLALRAELSSDLRAEILNGMGTSYKERKKEADDLESALRHCLEAEIYDPANPEWANDSGIVYYYQALDKSKAKEQSTAVKLMHKALERFDRAHDLAKRRTNNDKDFSHKIPDYRYDKANAYYLLSQWTDDKRQKQEHQNSALEELRFSLKELSPDEQANIHDLRSSIMADLGQKAQALHESQRAVELFPKKHSYHANLGYVFYQSEDYEKAIAEYEKALQLYTDEKSGKLAKGDETATNYRDSLGRTYYAARHDDDAIREYTILIDENPKSSVYANSLANAHFSKGEYELAIPAYQKALDLSPNDQILKENLARAYYNLAEDHRADLMYPQAAEEYQTALRYYQDPNYHLGLAHCYSSMKEADRAVDEYRKAGLADSDPDFHYWLGLAYKRGAQWDKAETEYQETLKLKPDHLDAQRSLGLLYQAAGKFEEAVPLLKGLRKKKPKDIDILMALGLSELEVNETKQAIAHLKRANELAPDDARTYSSLGQAYNHEGEYEQARELLQQASQNFPDDEYIKEELDVAMANSHAPANEDGTIH